MNAEGQGDGRARIYTLGLAVGHGARIGHRHALSACQYRQDVGRRSPTVRHLPVMLSLLVRGTASMAGLERVYPAATKPSSSSNPLRAALRGWILCTPSCLAVQKKVLCNGTMWTIEA